MGRIIGIDLGTTNSVVAVLDGPRPRILDSKEGKPQTRSAVGLRKRRKGKAGKQAGGPELLVGDTAVDNWPMAPHDTIMSVKRLMGRGFADREVEKARKTLSYEIVAPAQGTKDSVRVVMGGVQYSPADISAMILRKLKADAEFRLGEEVTHAVITVPAYFSEVQKAATREAAQKAGLNVIKLLDEPTAAAIAFGMDAEASEEPKTLLVYDLGGGTFDISVLMMTGSVFAPLNLEGDMWLGGDNFNQVLVDKVVHEIKEEYRIEPNGNKRFIAALSLGSQKAKETLSSARSADIILPGVLQDDDGDLIDVESECAREEFEELILPLVERTRQLTKQAIEQASLTPDQIDYVIMAGNSTMVPLVQQEVEKMFGAERVLRKMHPKHCVAMGAAIVATRIGERVVCDGCGHVNETGAVQCVKCDATLQLATEQAAGLEAGEATELIVGEIAPFHYGMQTTGDKFHVFIDKGEPYPADHPKVLSFPIPHARQRMISIPVYGGEHLGRASANEKQGEAFAILPPRLAKGTLVRIKMWLDAQGLFALEAHLEDGTDLHPWITRGESDAHAIQSLEKVEEILGSKAQEISAQEMQQLEVARDRVFDALRHGDYEQAMQEVRELENMAEAAGQISVRQQAENAANNMEYILQQYGALMDPNSHAQISTLIQQTRGALETGQSGLLGRNTQALNQAFDSLPDFIKTLFGIKAAIGSRIQPVDPAQAATLVRELDELERGLQRGDPTVASKVQAFIAKVIQAIQEADQKRPGGVQCRHCGAQMPAGKRACPSCGADNWTL